MKHAVCAVMVTHNPTPRVRDVVDSFLSQVDHLVIVDNASQNESLGLIKDLQARHSPRISMIANTENQWLAKALNQGVAWASDRGYKVVLLMNDGNFLSPNAVSTMLKHLMDPSLGRVGSVNPRVIIGQQVDESDELSTIPEHLTVTAGCLAKVEAYEAVGGHREDFLVDMVDYDFGFRLRRHGFHTLQAPSVTIACELGKTTRRRFLWRHCNVENYSALRRYYYARNGLTLAHEENDQILARDIRYFLLASVAKILLYERDKSLKLKMIAAGIRDARQGRLGAFQP